MEMNEHGVWERISDGVNYEWAIVQTDNNALIKMYYVVYLVFTGQKIHKVPSKKSKKRKSGKLNTLTPT